MKFRPKRSDPRLMASTNPIPLPDMEASGALESKAFPIESLKALNVTVGNLFPEQRGEDSGSQTS